MRLGYKYGKKKWEGALTPQLKDARIRQYLIQHALASHEEASGTAIRVYTDESYIHITY